MGSPAAQSHFGRIGLRETGRYVAGTDGYACCSTSPAPSEVAGSVGLMRGRGFDLAVLADQVAKGCSRRACSTRFLYSLQLAHQVIEYKTKIYSSKLDAKQPKSEKFLLSENILEDS